MAKPKTGSVVRRAFVRRSVTLDQDVNTLVHEVVGDTNFSAFINTAVREKVRSCGDELVRAVLRKATEDKWLSIVPAPVLAETLRGGSSDARVHRILKSRESAITLVEVSALAGRDAGERLGKAGMAAHNTIDALIVASSVAAGARRIVTCDPGDIGPLAGTDLEMIPI